MSVPARLDTRVRIEMLRWMRLARRLETRLEEYLEARRADGTGPLASALDGRSALRPPGADSGPEQGENAGLRDGRPRGADSSAEHGEKIGFRDGDPIGSGPCAGHGQEAVSVGAGLHARPDDVVAPSHRDTAVFLMRGMSAGRIVAQCLGKATGVTRGRDGDMHMGDMGHRIIASPFHLADTVPVAAGAALALKMAGTDGLALCFFEERAAARGDWHEGINLAAVRRLPVVFVCSTDKSRPEGSWAREFAVETIAEKAVAYGIPGVTVDGTDVVAVHEAVGEAVARARGGEGTSLVEALVFRAREGARPEGAASRSAPDLRRSARDPIARLLEDLERAKRIDRKGLAEMDGEIDRVLDEAFAWAAAQPDPAPEECSEGVYGGSARRQGRDGGSSASSSASAAPGRSD